MEKFGVDQNTLKQKVANLRKQCNDYDTLLKFFSVQFIDLPPSVQKDLDEYVHFKKKIGLYAMEQSFLSEWHCTITEQNIAKKVSISKATAFNERIEKELMKTNTELAEVKKFVDGIRGEIEHDDTDQLLREVNRVFDDLVQKRDKMEEHIKIDLDQVLMKLEQLV